MRNILRKLNRLLDKKQKRTMVGLAVLMVIGAFLEMANVALIASTVKQLTSPENVVEATAKQSTDPESVAKGTAEQSADPESVAESPAEPLTSPENVVNGKIAGTVYRMIGSPGLRVFAVIVMGALILSFIIKNAFLYLERKAILAFVYTNQFRTSERMMRNYIRRPYEFYLNADTSVVQRSITSDVNNMYALILALLH